MKFQFFAAAVLVLSACAMNPAHETHYDKDSVHKIITTHIAPFRACYETRLKKQKNFAGKIVMAWEILEDGTTNNVHVKDDTMTPHDASFESCMISIVEELKFQPAPPRNTVDVVYPFLFRN